MANDGAVMAVAQQPAAMEPLLLPRGRNSSALMPAATQGGDVVAGGSWELLLALPDELLAAHVIGPLLSAEDKAALRAASRCCRRLVNAATSAASLDACSTQQPGVFCEQVPRCFPAVKHLRITHDAAAAAAGGGGGGAGAGGQAMSDEAAASLERGLPLLLTQLPHLQSLTFEGPADRRQRTLDLTPALLALLAAAAPSGSGAEAACSSSSSSAQATSSMRGLSLSGAAAAAPAGACGDACDQQQQEEEDVLAGCPAQRLARISSSSDGSDTSTATTEHHSVLAGGSSASTAAPQLQELALRGGCLPDGLLELVGRLPSLQRLALSSQQPVNTRPLRALSRLTCLHLTVTPPLCAVLEPLTALTRLQEVALAALAPVRGWGPALARALPAASLRRLRLTFADVCDADVAALAAALPGLQSVDLNFSRHLTPAAVPFLASLSGLQDLSLEQTGLTLREPELAALGAGCRHLTRLSAEFDLRSAPEPPPPAAAAAPAAGAVPSPQQQQPITTAAASAPCWPALRRLTIPQGCSTATLWKLLAGCGGLRGGTLLLSGLGPNAPVVASHLAGRTPSLAQLTLDSCCGISAPAAAALGAGLTALTALTLSDVPVPPAALTALLASAAPHGRLAKLSCRRLSGLEDGVLRGGVGALGASLSCLELASCGAISGAALLDVARQLPRLQELVVEGCAGADSRATRRAWERQRASGTL